MINSRPIKLSNDSNQSGASSIEVGASPRPAWFGDRASYTQIDLLNSVETALRQHGNDTKFHRTFLGRLLGPVLGLADPDKIQITGQRFKQLLWLAGSENASRQVTNLEVYLIDVDKLRSLQDKACKAVGYWERDWSKIVEDADLERNPIASDPGPKQS
jgi:hypothetical protein